MLSFRKGVTNISLSRVCVCGGGGGGVAFLHEGAFSNSYGTKD